MSFRFALILVSIAALVACALVVSGCAPAQKEVDKAFEMSDELGKERQTQIMGREVIIHPEADKKISIPF